MANEYRGLIGLGKAIISKSRLSNAMGIPLVFVVIVFLGGLTGFLFTQKDFFFWIMLSPVIFFMVCFVFLMIFKPELLRTEEHEERMLQLATGMGQKGEELSETPLSDLSLSLPDDVKINKRSKEIKG